MIPAAASILFEAALRAFFAACVLWAGLRLLRVKNVRAQKAAWSVVLIAGLAMPLLMLGHWFPAWAEVRLPAAWWSRVSTPAQTPANFAHSVASPIQGSAAPPQLNPVTTDSNGAPDAPVSEFEASFEASPHSAAARAPISPQPAAAPVQPTPQKARRAPLDLLAAAWLVYLAVGASLLLRWLIGFTSSIRMWLHATPVEAARECGMDGVLATRSSSRISSPVNIGSGIILPADYPEWGTEKLRAVLAHERSHIRQRDFYLQLLAGFYAALTWFSPLGWWLKRKLSELSEAISDRAGLEESASRSAYAQLLLEFAALPRPTFTGVAMAHSTNLSHRIDRLLNESSFRQAFSGSRRALVAGLIVPAALVLGASLVRVQAATPAQADSSRAVKLAQDQPSSQAAVTGQSTGHSNPVPAQVSDSGTGQAPPAPPSPEAAPAPVAPSSNPAPEPAPAPPLPPVDLQDSGPDVPVIPPIPPIDVNIQVPPMPLMPHLHGYEGHAACFANGDLYAIVGDPGTKTQFCGNSGGEAEAEVDKARRIAHGHFLLIRHEGKFYVVDDPAIVSQIEAMDKAAEDQGQQMRALVEQMREAGRQAHDEARQARESAANIPAPDLSKEMAELNATVARLTAKQGSTVSHEELAQVQREISAIQRLVIDAEVKAEINIDMSRFKAEEGNFNEQMSRLGAEFGRTVQENHQRIGSIIDESLKDGKARPVE